MKHILYVLLLGFTFTSTAQHGSKAKYVPMVTHSIGGSLQKFDGLNSRIATLPQYEHLKDHAATLGIGWLKERNRVISGGGLIAGSSMSGDRDKKSSTIRYIGLNVDLGYDVINSEKIMLYPMAGLGVQKYQAIFYKDNSSVPFNEVLESPEIQNSIGSVRFNNSFFVYRLGFGVSFQSPKHPSSSIGLQAGYTASFKKKTWRSNENQLLANAPEDKLSQFFVGIVFTNKPMFIK